MSSIQKLDFTVGVVSGRTGGGSGELNNLAPPPSSQLLGTKNYFKLIVMSGFYDILKPIFFLHAITQLKNFIKPKKYPPRKKPTAAARASAH